MSVVRLLHGACLSVAFASVAASGCTASGPRPDDQVVDGPGDAAPALDAGADGASDAASTTSDAAAATLDDRPTDSRAACQTDDDCLLVGDWCACQAIHPGDKPAVRAPQE